MAGFDLPAAHPPLCPPATHRARGSIQSIHRMDSGNVAILIDGISDFNSVSFHSISRNWPSGRCWNERAGIPDAIPLRGPHPQSVRNASSSGIFNPERITTTQKDRGRGFFFLISFDIFFCCCWKITKIVKLLRIFNAPSSNCAGGWMDGWMDQFTG